MLPTKQEGRDSLLHELPAFKHIAVKELKEAFVWLGRDKARTQVIGGGTDLLGLMKDRVEGPRFPLPNVLVDISSVRGMQDIIVGDDDHRVLRIGASVPLSRLTSHQTITKVFPLLAQAALQVGTTQIRNMGTIGGNLCQKPRCLYFRHPHFVCRRKGGDKCFAARGEHRYHHSILGYKLCSAACLSDLATALAALGAKAIVTNSERDHEVSITELFSPHDSTRETCLKPDELLKEIRIPWPVRGSHQAFLKYRIRHSTDFSLVSAAVTARVIENDVCAEASIFLGAIAPFPFRFSAAETSIRGQKLVPDHIRDVSRAPIEGAHGLTENGYKVTLARILVERALLAARHQCIKTGSRRREQ